MATNVCSVNVVTKFNYSNEHSPKIRTEVGANDVAGDRFRLAMHGAGDYEFTGRQTLNHDHDCARNLIQSCRKAEQRHQVLQTVVIGVCVCVCVCVCRLMEKPAHTGPQCAPEALETVIRSQIPFPAISGAPRVPLRDATLKKSRSPKIKMKAGLYKPL